jgi:transposase InsO family protein
VDGTARESLENDEGATYLGQIANRASGGHAHTMQAPSCDVPAVPPSPLLALVSASIVHSFSPSWLSRPVCHLADELHLRADRVSRLKASLLGRFEALLDRVLKPGRPRQQRPTESSLRIRSLEALLGVVSEVLRTVSIRKRILQDRLVTGCDRLEREHGISRRDFASTLGLKERTLRSWTERLRKPPKRGSGAPASSSAAEEKDSRLHRAGRLGRFAFDVTLPGLQAMADTSDWELFGVPLKIVAEQDPGARREKLWEAFEVDDHEDSSVILKVLREAAEDKPGLQLLTDQGSPYMSQAVKEACEELEIEHAPQREGSPTEKATLERSFLTVKAALAPLVSLTGKLSEVLPALRNAVLAKAAGKLLIAIFLRGHRLGRRESAIERLTADPVVLEVVAEAQRERAWAEGRSSKLKLEEIHAAYRFPGSVRDFVRAHRRHRVEDIEEAERAMGTKACRCYARRCDRYFAAILRNVAEKNRHWRVKLREQRLADHQSRLDRKRAENERKLREANPEAAIADALDLLARQYRSERGDLAFFGLGPGNGRLASLLRHLQQSEHGTAVDRAEVGWRLWEARNAGQLPERARTIRAAFDKQLAAIRAHAEKRSTPELASDILGLRRSHEDRRPPPGEALRL